MIRRALISVSDKTGLLPFAQFLVAQGVELLSTGGTAELLRQQGIPVRDVSAVTEFPEMMDGRLKTLHPRVHGGLLARRDDAAHMEAAQAHGIGMIDLLVVNLYPFEATLNQTAEYDHLVENIDIGGPAMIRAAAKNHASVTVIVDVADYAAVETLMRGNANAVPQAARRRFAAKAFARCAAYDALISSWLSGVVAGDAPGADGGFPAYLLDAGLAQTLRYGENPHQAAALYRRLDARGGIANATQLQGKELSYNNLADADAAWAMVSGFETPAAVLIKHANPCGVASAADATQAFLAALAGDPVSAFGGILAVNCVVDAALVEAIGGLFLEVIAAPGFTPDALAALAAKKNLRLLLATPETHVSPLCHWLVQAIGGGYLVQQKDERSVPAADWKQVTGAPAGAAQMRDAQLAWQVVQHVKSNAIVLVKNGATIGVGAGQMSRVDAVRIAVEKARAHGHDPRGAVLASDAFFPFADNVERAAEAGISLIIQPGGSLRDAEVIDAANAHGIAMLFTGQRHFRH
ncbi:MAG: bifunctional phosphoribosylaminoimidazolecarboxamide formyltransferase/IMP cyclohydrolase [Alphaproteobacteria bacterium]|nr:bifunctional phosphoribosylaminoimidazolecarboxamide formyltransferase/IMP cyclohydrolase [Alphaproteobacteria bacterium]